MGNSFPGQATAPTYRRLACDKRDFRENCRKIRGMAPTYRRRSARQLAGPMTVTEMMDAYTVPLARICSMTTCADPHGCPPKARGAYLPGESAQTN